MFSKQVEGTTSLLWVTSRQQDHDGIHHRLHLLRTREGAHHRVRQDFHLTTLEWESNQRGPRLGPLLDVIRHLWHQGHRQTCRRVKCQSNTRSKTIEVNGCTTNLHDDGATLTRSEITLTTMCTDKATAECRATYQKEWTGTTADTSWQWTSNSTLQKQSSQKIDRDQLLERRPPVHARGVPLLPSTLAIRNLLWVRTSQRCRHHNSQRLSSAWSADSEEQLVLDWTLTSSTLRTP